MEIVTIFSIMHLREVLYQMTQNAERDLISSNQDLNGLLKVVLQSKWRLVSDRLQKIAHLCACIHDIREEL